MKIQSIRSIATFLIFFVFTFQAVSQDISVFIPDSNMNNRAPLVATAAIGNHIVNPGDNVVVPITVANWNNIIAITLYVRFKQGTLTFTGATGTPSGMLVGPLVPDSTINIGWNSLSPTNFNGTLLNLNFTYNGPGTSQLNFLSAACEVASQGFFIVPVTYTNGSVTASTTNPSHGNIINVDNVPTGSPVTVPVRYSGFTTNAGTLVQKIHYDQSKLVFSGISSAGTLAGATASEASGIITLNWSDPSGAIINYPPSEIGLNFTFTGSTATTLDFYPGCLIKTVGAVNIPVSYFSGTITPAIVPITTCPGLPSVVYGGQTYNTVLVGTQCWLRENLNIGTKISGSLNPTDNGVIEKSCYGNLDANCDTYGGLYQWNEMMQYTNIQGVNGICPPGWHIPTDDEYTQMTTFLGGELTAGGPLKETGTSHWTTPNTGATNQSGFTALPGGFNNSTGGFSQLHDNGYFWTSTEHASVNAWRRGLVYNGADVYRFSNTKGSAFSVRCLKDECTSYSGVSVTIVADANEVCQGTSVTFTATPVNGGSAPVYQWKVNGTDGGTNSPVFSYIPANNDIVTCILTSSLAAPCYTGNPATSNQVVMTVNPSLPVSITIVSSENPACQGATVSFTANTVNGGTAPSYQWQVNGANVGTSNPSYSYAPAENDEVKCILTSNALCASGNPATSNTVIMSVNFLVPVSVSISPLNNPVCEGTMAVFSAIPVNEGPLPVYQWKVNGINAGSNDPFFFYTPVNNDMVTCVLTSSLNCTTGNPATSNQVSMLVDPNQPVSVSIVASAATVCAGSTVTFTATPTNGGASPTYQWKVNGTSVGSSNAVYAYVPTHGDVITCEMTSDLVCTSGNPATSNPVVMTVNPILPVSITVSATATFICPGTLVTFTAHAVNGGTTPVYQWKVNGADVGTNNPAFSYVPADNDMVNCVLTSNAACTTGNPATSNVVTITVASALPAGVSIVASANPVCAGTLVLYTATPVNGGSSPVYQWKVNGTNHGSNESFLFYIPSDNDVITCVMTSSFSCATGNPATSNEIHMVVNPNLPVGVSISASANNVCAGTQVTFTATPTNGGTVPSYQWKVNGTNAGTNNPVFTYAPADNDVVTCILSSSLSCISGNPASSNEILMTVNPILPVSISVVASANPVCTGTSVAFFATPVNGGSNPTYQWKINGTGAGINQPVLSYTPFDNDIITCELTSSETCVSGNPAISNQVVMTVNQLMPVGVTVSPSINPACEGGLVTFTATPSNGGPEPAYQWKVNGINTGANSPVFSYSPLNNDVITCILTSNAACISGNPAISNPVTMVVNPRPLPTITGPASATAGDTGITYSTEEGMTGYSWTISAGGVITDGAGTRTITVSWNIPGAQTIGVNYTAPNGCAAASATVLDVFVNSIPAPTLTGPDNVCENSEMNVYFTETGMSNYVWTVSAGGTIVFGGTSTDNLIIINWYTSGAQSVSVNYQNAGGIPAPSPTVMPVTVHPTPQPVIAGDASACNGSGGHLYSTDPGMGNYQWTVSPGGIITAGGTSLDQTVTISWISPGPQTVSVNYTSLYGCTNPEPTVYNVAVFPDLVAGSVSGLQAICFNTVPTLLTGIAPTGGSIPYAYQWQSSTDNASFTDISGATDLNYQPGSLSLTTYYRLMQTSAYGCGAVYTISVPVTVYPNFVPGSIAESQSIPYNTTPQPLIGVAPSGGNVPYTYQWQHSPDGADFTDIPGATDLSYAPGSLTVTTWYRQVQVSADNCGAATTNILTITVSPQPFITIISPNGGEDWIQGSVHTITWDDNISENVKIDLHKGEAFHQIITASTLSTGSYSWTISEDQTPGEDYKVKISSVTDYSLYDMSDANFTISGVVPANLTIQNVTVPNGQVNCYNATQMITVAGSGTTFLVQNGGSATMIAGQSINYLQGTMIEPGGYLHGYIAPGGPWCGTVPPAMVAIVSGTDDELLASPKTEIKVYPNPTTGIFTVELQGEEDDDMAQITVYGMLGETVLSGEMRGPQKREFSLTGKPVGIYFLSVRTGKIFETIKIIKQN